MQQQHRLWRSQSDSLARTGHTVIWNDVDWASKNLGLEDGLNVLIVCIVCMGSARNLKMREMPLMLR